MSNLGRIVAAAGLAAGFALATGAQAHGFWFAQRANQLAMVFGVGADDLDVVKRLPKVSSFAAYDEVPDAIVSEKNWKYGVHLRRELGKPVPQLPGQTLQIIPVNAPLPVKLGQPVKLKVLFQGKPVAGARILADFVNDPDAKPLKTGKDGIVTIKVRNQGLNVIGATYDGPPEDPAKTKKCEHFATLSFVLPHAPE